MYISSWEGGDDISCYDYGIMNGRRVDRRLGGECSFQKQIFIGQSLLSVDAPCKS